jgi:NAD(P)-dependent dehydrogenase (short-subunit alcohol dehydrogenase family)
MALPSPTKNWHTDTYDSISPSRPELSIAGRRIVITGGGYGLGRELVKTFAEAGASEIAILGRSEGPLVETKKFITEKYPKTKVSHFVADITDLAIVKKAAESFGKWNTLILNAGYMPNKGAVGSSDVLKFWKGYEVNVKGAIVALNAFLPGKGEDAVVVATSTAGIAFPKNMTGGFTSYSASKYALVNLIEYVAVEEPDVHFINIHPGILETAMFVKFNNPDLRPDTCKFIKGCVN